jgi:hypothetical protein
MKNIKIMKAIAVLSVTLVCGFWGSVSVAGTCTGTSGVSSGTECLKEVTSFKLKVYEFGLCTDYPTVADRSKCTELFKNTGFDLAISKNASLPLGGSVSLTEGIYTHAYIIVDNNTYLKSVHEFSADRKDMAGNTGKFCYSNGIVRTEDANLELTNVVVTCGATDASAANKETIMFSTNANAYRNFDIINFNNEGALSDTDAGYTKLFALTAAQAASTAWANDHSILAGQKITPVTISTTTKGLNIAFTVTDNVSFNFIAHGQKIPSDAGDACAAGSGKFCISDVGWMGMQFLVTSN